MLLAFLRLRERRVVLKYLAKLTEKIDACTAEEQPVPEWCTKVRITNITHCVCTLRLKKICAKLFSSELCQISTNFDNFWQEDGKEAKIMRGALIFHLT